MVQANIEVGKTYKTRKGEDVMIVMKTDIFARDVEHDMFRPFVGDNGRHYTETGSVEWSGFGQSMDDLFKEVSPVRSSEEVMAEGVVNLVALVISKFFNRKKNS